MKLRSKLHAHALAFLLFAGTAAAPGRTHAAMLFTLAQVGNDVVITDSGSLNLTALTGPGNSIGGGFGQIRPSNAYLISGNNPSTYGGGITGPNSFGSGNTNINATSMTGSIAGVQGNIGILYVPPGYVSGTALSGTTTFANQTFASLGFTPGTYTYTWGTGVNADSLTITSVVPEPSTWALIGVGVAGLGSVILRRRVRLA